MLKKARQCGFILSRLVKLGFGIDGPAAELAKVLVERKGSLQTKPVH